MRRKRYFEWIAGEDIGNVVSLVSIEEFEGETFYNFDDGESCNLRFISRMTGSSADLKDKFMVEIENPSNPWTFETIKPKKYVDESMKGQDIDIPTLNDILQARGTSAEITNSDIGNEKLVPPRRKQNLIDLPKLEDYIIKNKEPEKKEPKRIDPVVKEKPGPVSENIVETKVVEDKILKKNNNDFVDPVRILVHSCKKHDTPVEMTINMKLPSKTIYNIAVNEFEDGLDKFIDCIVDGIDTKMIIDQLKEALRDAYLCGDEQ